MLTNHRKPAFCARWLLAGCAAIAMAASHETAAAAATCDQIVVFGTSLSDPGNAFALGGGTNTPPDYSLSPLLIPDKPYGVGGHHFSNGATWIEQFAASVGMAASAGPAFQAENPGATNFAVAGARSYDDGHNVNLSVQVSAFFEQCGGASGEALYVIEMGGNDVRDAMEAFADGNAGAVIQAALTSIATNIAELHARGARNFLVADAPNVGLTPASQILESLSPGAVQLGTALTVAFNNGLSTVVGQLSTLLGIDIRWLDRYRALNEVVGNPTAFGLTNVTSPCITPEVPPFVCDDPDQFLFWDGIHPTRAAHAIIAQRAAVLLAQ